MLIAKVRQSVRPYAWNIGRTAWTTLLSPAWICGIHARACAAFASRFPWLRTAPFGVPVVPEVYWMSAVSSVVGRGWRRGSRRVDTRSSHLVVPRTFVVSFARDSRAFATGSDSARRVVRGMARVRSTDTMASSATSTGKSCSVATDLSQTTATRAPWSSNWWRSSRGVYSGLCSTTMAPSRRTA
jgi:hypothetical protein